MENLKALSYDLRKNVVDMIMEGKGGHIGGDMSVMDILVELYFEQMNISPEQMEDPDRDRHEQRTLGGSALRSPGGKGILPH